MRRFLLATSLVAMMTVSACGKKAERSEELTTRGATAVDVVQAARTPSIIAPGIDPRAAPGVAFTYLYDFVLPDKSIAAVQESHASACEKLGPTQCRITGMRYTLLDDERISAKLEFKLSPVLARAFGKEGIAAVEKASGKLVDAEINGTDVAPMIETAQQIGGDAATQLAEVERKLATGKLGNDEAAELQAQARELRAQVANAKTEKVAAQVQLASTPMSFSYKGDAGFSLGGNPVGDAFQATWGSFSSMIWFVLTAIGVALPWVLLGGLLLAIWRSRPGQALRKFVRGNSRQTVKPTDAV